MPQYKVIAPGFYNDQLYHPEGKRRVLTVDLPFSKGKKSKNPMPSWVTDMPKETAAVKKKRELAEEIAKIEAEEKSAEDKEAVAVASSEGDSQEASFLAKSEEGVAKSNNVETL